MGSQLNPSSGNIRPVRRTLRDATSVNFDSCEGWCLTFGSLPVNAVCDVWNEVESGGLEKERALSTLQSLVYRKRVSDLPEGNERILARLRYGGPHVDAVAAEVGPVNMWEWYHGGDHREWKAYRGGECELLERRYQQSAHHALMNGGKPTDHCPTRPLRVLFNSGWASQGGRILAAHTQIDLVSRRRRGVRRQIASKGTWDYIFFVWISKFPFVHASQVYMKYDAFLRQMLEAGPASSHVELRANAEASLAALQVECQSFIEPPQDDIPEHFVCPIGNTLMLTPAFRAKCPHSVRMEKERLTKWVREKGAHPITNEHMEVCEVVPDFELIAEIATWL